MRRREALVLLLGAAAWPLAARGQQRSSKLYRVAYLSTEATASDRHDPLVSELRDALRELGYVDGAMIFEARLGGGRADLLPSLADELIALNPHVIVAPSTAAAVAVRRATTTVPIVFALVADPIAVGLVDSIPRPGGNATGLTTNNVLLMSKRLELLRELVPAASTIGILLHFDDASNVAGLSVAKRAAPAQGLTIRGYGVRDGSEVESVLQRMKSEGVQAVTVLSGLLRPDFRAIAEIAARLNLPATGGDRSFPDAGGLASYSTSFKTQLRRAAFYVDKILKGTKPADLPIEQPTRFELVINLKTAKALGLTIPPTLLARADEVIE
jgi:putative ABC transport system substrate-binding protein